MASIPKRVEDRLVAGIKKFQPILALAKSRDVNESDTVVILNDLLAEIFGYAKYFEITSEFAIRGTYCDLAIKLEGKLVVLIEAKSVGEEIFKIGMTRRLEPMDRIDELSDASVPFDFDVHAMIPCEDAPALEYALHHEFDDLRINQINFRKEFFRVPLERIRSFITNRGIDASFTALAEAHEWRETQVVNKMTPDERERYYQRRESEITASTLT